MDYTPLINTGYLSLTGGLVLLVGGLISFLVIVFLWTVLVNGGKDTKKGSRKTVASLLSVATVAIWMFGSIYTMEQVGPLETENVELVKSNIELKYDIDTNGMEVSNPNPIEKENVAHGAGEYQLTKRDDASTSILNVEFDETGEPSIIVNQYFTEEEVRELLRTES